MRPLRILLHAFVLPAIYIAFQLIKLAPREIKDEVPGSILKADYYALVGAFILMLLILFYGSFVTGQRRALPLQKRKMLVWVFIGVIVVVDSALIYYLNGIEQPAQEFLT